MCALSRPHLHVDVACSVLVQLVVLLQDLHPTQASSSGNGFAIWHTVSGCKVQTFSQNINMTACLNAEESHGRKGQHLAQAHAVNLRVSPAPLRHRHQAVHLQALPLHQHWAQTSYIYTLKYKSFAVVCCDPNSCPHALLATQSPPTEWRLISAHHLTGL